MKCLNPFCGRDIIADALFCPYCGTKMSAVCSNCGAELVPDAVFCSKCGTSVTASNSALNQVPQNNEPKTFTPSAQPFFTRWIAEHKKWAKEKRIVWISKFYEDYAIAVLNSSSGEPLKYRLIKGEQEPQMIDIIYFDMTVNAYPQKIYTDKHSIFENGSQYFAYDLWLEKENEKDRELLNDDVFLKSFGGKNFDRGHIAEHQHFCGVYHYDGSRLRKCATSNTIDEGGGFLKYPPYAAMGNYIAVFNNEGVILEKNFYPYNILDPIKGETVVSNAMLPHENDSGIFNNILTDMGGDYIIFLPYNDSVTKYDFTIYNLYKYEWVRSYLKVLFTQTGKILPCNDYSHYENINGISVLMMRHPNGNFYLLNRLGCKLEFNTSSANGHRYYYKYLDDQDLLFFRRSLYDADGFPLEVEEYKVYKLSSLQNANPSATLLGEFIADGYSYYFVEYAGKRYTAYQNDGIIYVADENFKQIFKIKQADRGLLTVGVGDNNDILYLGYLTKDDLREYLNIKDLNNNKTVITFPKPDCYTICDYCVHKFNGFLFLSQVRFRFDEWIGDIALPDGTIIPKEPSNWGWDTRENYHRKCKNLPKSKIFLHATFWYWGSSVEYRIVDLKTGEYEDFKDSDAFEDKLRREYGFEE